jgi:hypothetical protein
MVKEVKIKLFQNKNNKQFMGVFSKKDISKMFGDDVPKELVVKKKGKGLFF